MASGCFWKLIPLIISAVSLSLERSCMSNFLLLVLTVVLLLISLFLAFHMLRSEENWRCGLTKPVVSGFCPRIAHGRRMKISPALAGVDLEFFHYINFMWKYRFVADTQLLRYLLVAHSRIYRVDNKSCDLVNVNLGHLRQRRLSGSDSIILGLINSARR